MSKIKKDGEWINFAINTVNNIPPDETGNVNVEVPLDDFYTKSETDSAIAAAIENISIQRQDADTATSLTSGVYVSTSATTAYTLGAPTSGVDFEVTLIATGKTTLSITAPSGYIVGDDTGFAGLSAGNTLTLSSLTATTIYELSFKLLDATHIGMMKKEWATA